MPPCWCADPADTLIRWSCWCVDPAGALMLLMLLNQDQDLSTAICSSFLLKHLSLFWVRAPDSGVLKVLQIVGGHFSPPFSPSPQIKSPDPFIWLGYEKRDGGLVGFIWPPGTPSIGPKGSTSLSAKEIAFTPRDMTLQCGHQNRTEHPCHFNSRCQLY